MRSALRAKRYRSAALLLAFLLSPFLPALFAQEANPAPAAAQPDDILIDDVVPAAPAAAPAVLRADDLAKLPPPPEAATSYDRSATAPVVGDQVADLEVSVPPDCTVHEAITHLFAQLPSLIPDYTWASNAMSRLQTTKTTFSTPVGKVMLWNEALLELLKPQGLDYLEDGRLVRLGPADVIETQRASLAQERLARNHKKITVAFDGQALKFALENIQSQAGISMNYNYMESSDLNPVVVDPAPLLADSGEKKADGEINADQIQAQAAAQAASASKKVTYSTPPGMPQEWRMVLREVLDPCDYDFIEIGGVVRPMTRAKIEAYHAREIDEQPLVVRVVRVYHAAPNDIVAQLSPAGSAGIAPEGRPFSIFKHRKGFINLSRPEASSSKTFKGSGLSAASAGGGTTVGGMVSDSSNFGSMDRPRTPPSVVIGDIASNLDAIEAHIRTLDVRERQVVIEAKIFEVGADIDRKLGVNWQNFGGRGSFTSGVQWVSQFTRKTRDDDKHGSSQDWNARHRRERDYVANSLEEIKTTTAETKANDNSADTFTQEITHDFGAGLQAILNPLEFNFYWEAVQDSSDFKMVSQPVLVIGDHSEALIRVGTVTPAYTKTTSFANENNNMSESYEWQMIQDGVSLWVVPEICPDGRSIRLSVHPQFSVVGEMVEAPNGGGQFPMMGIREVDTRVVVPTGNTLLLGGLIEANSGRSQRKVPLLGDIPYLGRLFRWDSKNKTGKNLVILLTPTILDDENPDSGYEKPAAPIVKGLLEGLGKDLKDPSLREKVGAELPDEAKEAKRRKVFIDEENEGMPAE